MTKMRLLLVVLLAVSISACTSKYEQRSKSDKSGRNTEQPDPYQETQQQAAEPVPPTVTIPDQPMGATGEVQPSVPVASTDQTNVTPPQASWQAPMAPPEASGQAPQVQRSVEDSLQAVTGANPELSVGILPSGEPVLEIRYPWTEFSRPSIQMAWTEKEAGVAGLKPITLDDTRAESLWQKELTRIDQPKYPGSPERIQTTLNFLDRKDGRPISVRVRKNSLGKVAGYAVDESTGSSVVFYLLNSWVDEAGSLKFALGDLEMAAKLAKPGKVQVWFMSQEQPVWSETVDWPGKQAGTEVTQQPAAPSPEMPSSQVPDMAPASPAAPGTETPVTSTPTGAPLQEPTQPVPSGLGSWAAPSTSQPPASQVDLGTPASAVNPPEPVVANPAERPQPPAAQEPTPDAKPDIEKMSIDELARHIEKQYGATMSPTVRRLWVGGLNNYYRSKNPLPVRRSIFMDLLSSAYDEKPPIEIRKALRAMYFKLDADRKWESSKGR